MSKTTWVQVADLEQTLSTVASVAPAVLRSCACCWSNWIVSVQCGLYQNVSRLLPVGTVIVWVSVLSPFTGALLPSWAAKEPVWAPEPTTRGENAPLAVHPLRSPVSNPPLVTTVPPPPPVTVSAVVALWPGLTVWLAGETASEKSFPAACPQLGNLKLATRVCQLKLPLAGMYSLTYQNVQSSAGSTVISV